MAFNEKWFKIIKLLSPKSNAFSLFIQKKLTQFFEGLTTIPDDFRDHLHQVWLDIFPSTTRELTAWKEQFGIIFFPAVEADQRQTIDTEWKLEGGQGKDYIEAQLIATGFDVQVHENIAPVNPDIYHEGDNLLVNGPVMIAGNIPKTYEITDDSDYWGYFFFIGGDAERALISDKLADPSTLPTGIGYGAAFSSDGTYLCIAHDTTPYVTIYKRSGDVFTKLPDPSTLPTGIGVDSAFSADDTYLCITHSTTPYVTIYKRAGDVFTKLPDPAALPTGDGRSAAFSADDTYLCIAHTTSSYVTIYKRSRTGVFFIESVSISADRENEFKRLILKLKPAQTWVVLVVDFV